MSALTRRLVIVAVAVPGAGAAAVVALLVTAFAALAGTGDGPAGPAVGDPVCISNAAVDDAAPCVGGSGGNVTAGARGGGNSGVTAGGWGGYSNGLIPASALCTLTAPGQLLRCDAAAAWNAMSAALQQQAGSPICITDSYRSLAVQVGLRAEKPTLAAVPGTSNHGWALAVDLCEAGRIGMGFTTPTYQWLRENAARFGWVHPTWADPGRGQEEPWHWEYVGGAS